MKKAYTSHRATSLSFTPSSDSDSQDALPPFQTNTLLLGFIFSFPSCFSFYLNVIVYIHYARHLASVFIHMCTECVLSAATVCWALVCQLSSRKCPTDEYDGVNFSVESPSSQAGWYHDDNTSYDTDGYIFKTYGCKRAIQRGSLTYLLTIEVLMVES